jgi:hypothetical protein
MKFATLLLVSAVAAQPETGDYMPSGADIVE